MLLFFECLSLINIDLSNFNTKNTIDMSCMVYECNSLTNINLFKFNTENVLNMSGMFIGCKSLTFCFYIFFMCLALIFTSL